jgi:hypothetical protein
VSSIPRLFAALVDDAAVFPPGNAPLPEAVSAHRTHRVSWYADLVGPLLVPASRAAELGDAAGGFPIGLIGDTGLPGLDVALAAGTAPRQVELAVARRGEDPLPGLRSLLEWHAGRPFEVYAEIPLTWGCLGALDLLAESEAGRGAERGRASPKFRTGGLAAELFPTPDDLAAVIVACAERGLRYKLTAGLHHAIRHTEPETGFTHHGFLNVLVASAAAAAGEPRSGVAGLLALTTPDPLVRAASGILHADRPLWTGFGSCSIAEPLDDLVDLGLLSKENPR